MKIEKSYRTYFLLSTVFLSTQVYANAYINGMTGVAAGKADETGSFFGKIGGGYHVADNVDMGANWSYIGNQTQLDTDPSLYTFEIYGRINTSLNAKSKFYLDAGIRGDVDNFMAGIGVLYLLTDNLELDVGYRHYNSPNNNFQGDVYTFGLGLQYNFGTTKTTKLKNNEIVNIKSDNNISSTTYSAAPIIPKNDSIKKANGVETGFTLPMENSQSVSAPYHSACKVIIQSEDVSISGSVNKLVYYTVKKNDWLLKIGRDNCIALNALIKINPWLEKKVKEKYIIHPGEKLLIPER